MHSVFSSAHRHGRSLGSALLLSLALPLVGGITQAQDPSDARTFMADYAFDTGMVENNSSDLAIVASFTVAIQGASSVQLHFDDVLLAGDVFAGTASILRITSHLDGAVQELNRYHVDQWRRRTAYFNGHAVQVDIVAHPGTGANRARLGQVFVEEAPTVQYSQCGPVDDRVASFDPRANRIMPVGCTAWLIDDCNQCMLSAGHCSGGFSTAQFNVPVSNPNGSLNHPSPDHQYAVDSTSLQAANTGIGNDWAHFGTFANSNTGLTAGEAQGMTYVLEVPTSLPASDNIRITGYGTDSGATNQIQQTHVGPWILFTGNRLAYQTDTTGGNSGSPVIWEENGTAIGIHTNAGCSATSGNNGTALTNNLLQAAIDSPNGVCQAAVRMLSVLPDQIPSNVPTLIDLAVEGTVMPGTANLYVRYDGGSFLEIPLTFGGGSFYQAVLPPPTCDAVPEFYISANVGDCGGAISLPENAPVEFFSIPVGDPSLDTVYDMEVDMGWGLAPSGDTAGSGLWERVDPIGSAAQPEDDHTAGGGTECWVTGQFGDVDGGRTTLLSPLLDLSTLTNPTISYWRWYSNNTGNNTDDRFRVAISEDDGASWTSVEDVGPQGSQASGGWFQHSFRVSDFITPTSQVRMRFRANDTGGGSEVEAAIDDFEVFAVSCDAVLADCNGNGIVDSDDIASARSLDVDGNGIPDECALFTEYCFCPSGPCGNSSPTSGCLHSEGLGGRTAATGSTSVSNDDLVISSFDLPSNKFGLMFMGGSQIQAPFGDGLRCVGSGGQGVYRFGIQNSGAAGIFVLGPGLAALSAQRFGASGTIGAGSTWKFQAWLRDPMGPCASGFTTGSAISVTFAP